MRPKTSRIGENIRRHILFCFFSNEKKEVKAYGESTAHYNEGCTRRGKERVAEYAVPPYTTKSVFVLCFVFFPSLSFEWKLGKSKA